MAKKTHPGKHVHGEERPEPWREKRLGEGATGMG